MENVMKFQPFSSGQAVTRGKGPNGGVSVIACLMSMEPIGGYNDYYYYYYYCWLQLGCHPVAVIILHVNKYEISN
jgi:hypothetical protein